MSKKSREKESITKKLLFKLGITKSSRKGIHFSKSLRKKISKAKLQFLQKNPEIAREHSRYMKHYWHERPDKVAEHRKFLIELWKNPERRARARKIGIEVYRNHPNLRQASRLRFIAWLTKHENALRYLEQSKGNPKKLGRITMKKEKVRSLYEVIVANWLFKHNIDYFYEGKMLIFPEYNKLKIVFAVPDFFIPDYNALIEVYGGFPGSRARTIKKNRAYNHYGIPILGITPSMINHLDTVIPKFLKTTGENHHLSKEARKIMWGMLD